MKHHEESKRNALRWTAQVLTLAIAPLALAQEPAPTPTPPKPHEEPKPQDPPKPDRVDLPPMPGEPQGQDPLQEEMIRLFGKVETRLRAIDTQMYEAAAGRVPTKPIAGSGIEELLRSGQSKQMPQSVGELLKSASEDSAQTQSDILRILEIAEAMGQQSKPQSGSGSGTSSPGSGGKSPLDQPGGQSPGGREKTPEGPGSKNEEKQPGEGEIPNAGPDDPNRSAKNQSGQNPPKTKTAAGSNADGADRWGDLPVRAREVFRVEGASDLPPQYRDWIDGYYRRLQSLERR